MTDIPAENLPHHKISVTAHPRWKDCRTMHVAISMGQKAHDGEKLHSLLHWTRARSDLLILNVSDTLNRHNLRHLCGDDKSAHGQALAMGDAWLARNRALIKSFEGPGFIVKRWDSWLAHPDYPELLKGIQQLLHENLPFRDAVMQDATGFMRRRNHLLPANRLQEMTGHCIDYLLEEVAVYILVGRTYRANRVYPSSDLESFVFMRENTALLPAALRGLELTTHVNINFKKYSPVALSEAA